MGRRSRVENSRRSDFNSIRRELDAHNACLPSNRKDANAFVEELIRQTPTVPFIACASPDFATGQPNRHAVQTVWNRLRRLSLGRHKCAARIRQKEGRPGDLSAHGAPHRPVVALCLAGDHDRAGGHARRLRRAEARSTVVDRDGDSPFVGKSSSGKTTVGRVGQQSVRSPTIETDYEATDRGIAEDAYRRNNLVLVIDDTESAGNRQLGDSREDAQVCPPRAARSLQGDFDEGLEVGPSRAALVGIRRRSGPSRSRRWRRGCSASGAGTASHILDIALPNAGQGRHLGSPVTADRKPPGNSAEFIDELEDGLLACFGVLFGAWIKHLLAHDLADRVD